MKKFVYFLIVFSLIISCKKNNKSEENTDNQNNITKVEQVNDLPDKKEITIIGDQIWVRSEPTTGDVVMKLDNGTVCSFLEKGKKETINGVTDFWYKIEYNGQEGWVFGSQTNLSLNQSAEYSSEDEIIAFLKDFISAAKSKSGVSKYFINDSLSRIYNPGAFPVVTTVHYTEILDYFDNIKVVDVKFTTKLPEFNMDLYEFKEKGIYVSDAKLQERLKPIWDLQFDIYGEEPQNLPDFSMLEKNISNVVLITDISEGAYLYIGKYNGNFKIFVIDLCTHDA